MKFIGRDSEVAALSQALNNQTFSSVLIYGRRRVGKTELIRHCLSKSEGRIIPFCAGKTLYTTNFDALVSSVAMAYQLPLSFKSLPELLNFIGEKSKSEKTFLVIDEYSYFRDNSGKVDSDFQAFIDSYQHVSHLTLILSGSIVRIMKALVEADSPLYGRFQTILELQPFGYREAAEFYPERSDEEKLFLYACFGGVPHYLLLLDPKESCEENLIRLLFGVNGVLKGEADTLLNDELSAIDNANSVLSLIGNRGLHYNEINQLYPSGAGNGATYILKKLLGIGLIKRSISLDDKSERNPSYEIADPFLRFYFTFFLPTRSFALLYTPEEIYKRFVEKKLYESYLPALFEEVARQFLINENKLGRLEEPLLGIGSYTFSRKDPKLKAWINGQFDVVTQDAKGYIDYECKYRKNPLTLRDAIEESDSVKQSGVPFYRIGFFSRSVFADDLKKSKAYSLFALSDLYRK